MTIQRKVLNRKTASKLLLINWSRFQNVCINLDGSTLITGVNGTGKSTILDAMTYVLTGNTQFNKAAKDRDRTVKAYVRGDTHSNGDARYLRSGMVISYIAMEFYSPAEEENIVIGVCIESQDEVSSPTSNWFVCRNSRIEDINFAKIEGKVMVVTPKSKLMKKSVSFKSAEFMGRDKGTYQVLRTLGLRCDVNKYRSKLLKMMAFDPQNNIDQFISECVLEPGTVNSLKELREQRDQFDKIKMVYEELKASKFKLEEVNKKIEEYELKQKNLNIRKMMLVYQEILFKNSEIEDITLQVKNLEQKIQELKRAAEEQECIFEQTIKRLSAAEANSTYCDMKNSIAEIENQMKELEYRIKNDEEDVAKLLKLQMFLGAELAWTMEGENSGQFSNLRFLAEEGYSVEKKSAELVNWFEMVEGYKEDFATSRVRYEDTIKKVEEERDTIEKKIKQLEANIIVYPDEVVRAKTIIQDEFLKLGIKTDVRIFAELVQSVKDISWRKAIETFMGRKRFYLIVDAKYCHKAIEILKDKKIHDANVVLTDKLPDKEIQKNSAAEQLVIPNVFARKFANYLLNGIHLCENLEELHEYPKGGLTKDGMLAKGYAVSYMKISKTEVCLGQGIVELQKKKLMEQHADILKHLETANEELINVKSRLRSLNLVKGDVSDYHVEAPEALKTKRIRVDELKQQVNEIQNNPAFLAIIQEKELAEKQFNEAKVNRDYVKRRINECESETNNLNNNKKRISGELVVCENQYKEMQLQYIGLEQEMKREYERLCDKKQDIRVLAEKTVAKHQTDLYECEKSMEKLQHEYCNIAHLDWNKTGAAFIPFYREEYRNIANVRIEEARGKLIEQSKKLEDVFMNDFVAEINETILEAKREIDIINRELKMIPFGHDTYKFRMTEKKERDIFFRICKRLEDYLNSPEIYMNSNRDDEEMERDIKDFMEMILAEEDESEYTDYRKYFTYDMEITSRQGEEEVVADLSKKQGSASNGEKQTPYFIILAASLLQCYPKNGCCARLAFIDEAFSALSRERIEQMVKYLEDNDFQVIYAAPPEKIGSIGTYISTTVSLIAKGRYTNAVEGLGTRNESF